MYASFKNVSFSLIYIGLSLEVLKANYRGEDFGSKTSLTDQPKLFFTFFNINNAVEAVFDLIKSKFVLQSYTKLGYYFDSQATQETNKVYAAQYKNNNDLSI